MNDIVPVPQPSNNPFSRAVAHNSAGNVGAISIESERAIAEAQGQMVLAKRFPRDLNAAHAEMMIACKSPAFAEIAFYAKPQGGKVVRGPSIRMAEQLAQCIGNFQYGSRELSRDDKKSEIEVFAWDMEKNNYIKQQKTVFHTVDTKEGPKKLRDQTQIDQKINNVASKEKRGLIIALIPKWLVEDAIRECEKTAAGNNDEPIDTRVRKMVQAFAKFGVKPEHLEKYLGHKLAQVVIDELVDLTGIHTALREGAQVSEFFSADSDISDADTSAAQAITAAAAASKKATPASQSAPAAKPTKPAAKPAPAASKPVEEPAAAEPNEDPEVAANLPPDSISDVAPQAAGDDEEPDVF